MARARYEIPNAERQTRNAHYELGYYRWQDGFGRSRRHQWRQTKPIPRPGPAEGWSVDAWKGGWVQSARRGCETKPIGPDWRPKNGGSWGPHLRSDAFTHLRATSRGRSEERIQLHFSGFRDQAQRKSATAATRHKTIQVRANHLPAASRTPTTATKPRATRTNSTARLVTLVR